MNDPYNSADAHEGKPPPPPLVRRTVAADKRRRARSRNDGSSQFGATYSALIPVWNVIALVVSLVMAADVRRSSLSAVIVLYSPLALAIVASIWVESRGFATFVRVLNGLLATYVMFKLLRFMRMDIYTFKLFLMFVTTVFVPALNAIYLKPRQAE